MSKGKPVPVSSMTGFARAQDRDDRLAWSWEVRSVNGKGLDLRIRLPSGFDSLEAPVRQRVSARFRRGNFNLVLDVQSAAPGAEARVDPALLERVLVLAQNLATRHPELRPASIDGLLSLCWMRDTESAEPLDADTLAARDDAILATLDRALAALDDMRRTEGAVLAATLRGHLDRIVDLTSRAERLAAAQPAAIRARLRRQVQEVLDAGAGLSEERLAQEVALLAAKADLREELDRLLAHGEAARALIDGGGPIGRKLDFLCQELNRESNTLCAKSSDVDLTRLGLDLKAAVEQLREQVQNVE